MNLPPMSSRLIGRTLLLAVTPKAWAAVLIDSVEAFSTLFRLAPLAQKLSMCLS